MAVWYLALESASSPSFSPVARAASASSASSAPPAASPSSHTRRKASSHSAFISCMSSLNVATSLDRTDAMALSWLAIA